MRQHKNWLFHKDFGSGTKYRCDCGGLIGKNGICPNCGANLGDAVIKEEQKKHLKQVVLFMVLI